MADEKTVKKGERKYSNPNELEFPLDTYGITRELKTAFVRCVSRVGGDKKKLEVLNDTLKVLLAHKNDRFADMQEYKGSVSNKDADVHVLRTALAGVGGVNGAEKVLKERKAKTDAAEAADGTDNADSADSADNTEKS